MEVFKPLIHFSIDEIIEADRKWDAFFLLPESCKIQDSRDELYPDIGREALLTSYQDYYQILNDIDRGENICDLGAGLCRGSFLAQNANLPDCYSIELSKERIDQAKAASLELGYDEKFLIHADIANINTKRFHHFYLYFPKSTLLFGLLQKLRVNASMRKTYLYVTESHGDMISYLNELNFLKHEASFRASLPRHHNETIKYRVLINQPDSLLVELTLLWGRDVFLSFTYEHLILKQKVDWLFPLSLCDLHMNDKAQVEFLPFKRKINLEEIKYCEVSEFERNQLKDGAKLLRGKDGYFLEDKTGRVSKIS